MTEKELKKLFRIHFLLFLLFSYVGPLVYFGVTTGVTQQVTKIFLPFLIVGFMGVARLAIEINRWTKHWKPSFMKGLIKGLPKILLFVILVTFGLTFKIMLERQIDVAFRTYFETVLIVFGGGAVGSVFYAFYLYYYEQYLIKIGYVLGAINN